MTDMAPTNSIINLTAPSVDFEGITLNHIPPYAGIYAGVAIIDKHLAERLLKSNTRNRPMREGKVSEYARAMRSGTWAFNAEAIKISSDGVLADGQHRLQAITWMDDDDPGYPLLVVYGLTPESQLTMDQGAKRTAHEQLALTGAEVDTTIAAAIRALIAWDTGLYFANRTRSIVGTDAIIAWAKERPEAVDAFHELSSRGYRKVVGLPPSITLACAYRFNEIDSDSTAEFFSGLVSPVGLTHGSPILALRHRMERVAITRERISAREFIAYTVTAWNHYRNGNRVATITRPRTGTWTEDNFPEAI